jgi:hypothetical protein
MISDRTEILKKAKLAGVLERICQALELSDTQYQLAKDRYEAVGRWLADGSDYLLRDLQIYPQGSVSIGTTVKPLGRNEYDVDLVSFAPELTPDLPPALLKAVIGARLRANGFYAPILIEKQRCWRLDYANEFHLDITPSIRNPDCQRGGELVPDKEMRDWKATNPRGYRARFVQRAALQPRGRITESVVIKGQRGDIEPYPPQLALKGLLCRCVQIEKRHRDVYFERNDPALTPISVIVTTLTAQSYEHCVAAYEYETEFDLVCDVARHMVDFVSQIYVDGRLQWMIPNETTHGENFAEKWNRQPALAEAFFSWHGHLVADLDSMASLAGLDRLTKSLESSFGPTPVAKALRSWTDEVSTARAAERLWVAPSVGVTVAAGVGTRVRPNTNFGAD